MLVYPHEILQNHPFDSEGVRVQDNSWRGTGRLLRVAASSNNLNNAWSVVFGNGNSGHGLRSDNNYVRLVRGRQSLGTLTTPSSDFTDNGDGTVTHKKTGLIWKRCSEGQTWTGATCSGTASTHTFEQAVELSATYASKADWRVPNIQELQSIVEYGAAGPAINTAIFLNTPLSYFWSLSTYAGYSSNAWMVDFNVGNAISYDRSGDFHVRLMRGSQLVTSTPSTNSSDCLFNWAEQHYSSFLSPAGATSGTLSDYYYRYYSGTSSYLATKSSDNHLYFMGPATGNAVTDLGVVSDWLTQAGCQ